jgi:hypothetical protein
MNFCHPSESGEIAIQLSRSEHSSSSSSVPFISPIQSIPRERLGVGSSIILENVRQERYHKQVSKDVRIDCITRPTLVSSSAMAVDVT